MVLLNTDSTSSSTSTVHFSLCPNHQQSAAHEQMIQQYSYKIEAVFDHKEARETFRKFLRKDCLNEEPFIFYEAVEQYNKTRLNKNRYELARDIIDKFILVGSSHELNLSMNDRKELLNRWKQITEANQHITNEDLLQCPPDLFSRIQDLLFIELKVDNFPRFIQSETFKKFLLRELKRTNEHILEKLGTRKTSSSCSSLGSTTLGVVAVKKRTSSEDVAAASSSSTSSLSALSDLQVSTTNASKASSTHRSSSLSASSESFSSSSSSIHVPHHEEEDTSHDSSSTTDEDHSEEVDLKISNFYDSSSDNLSVTSSFSSGEIASSKTMTATHSSSTSSSPQNNSQILPILDETNTCITEKDYQLALQLHQSYYSDTTNSNWKVVDEKIGMKTAISPKIYTFNYSMYQHHQQQQHHHSSKASAQHHKEISNNLKFFIAQSGIVPGTTREWIDLLYGEHVQKHFGELYKTRFQVDYYSMNPEKDIPFPTSFIYAEAPLPFPFTNRDFIYAKTIIPDQYDPSTGLYDRYVLIMKPSSHHDYPAKSNPIRASHHLVYVVEKYTKASVRYAAFETGDMAGKIPKTFSAQFCKGTARMMHRKVRKVCEKAYESAQKSVPVRDHDGGLATLKEYEQYLEKKRVERVLHSECF
ncbi:hypothetical protein C9374_002434 [Naegleria lovaniensis]|uniref:RGS domain-containing protein n=1 Tax=Naegleria lovaniensis TaxID=51637 RepID=A0AA88GPS4_NAELO|nr:uncharacterized protein C9374_002434 [Naegleria lovaniensis]KAG2386690.1 hypothetical protein C9374_002434 [Naegleria lovaniensis]